MTDAHFHRDGFPAFLANASCEWSFLGTHPWQAEVGCDLVALRAQLEANPQAGVGEIGLDRLKTKTTTPAQNSVFAAQLALAAELGRPVVLHGAKCWGEVVKACRPFAGRIPTMLFHGFSRSEGLLPDIFAMNGFISVGPAVLNDHAVNYRALVKTLPIERLLVETDAVETEDRAALLVKIVGEVASLRGVDTQSIEAATDANALKFLGSLA